MTNTRGTMMKDLVVILAALNVEYHAVRQRLVNPRVHRHKHGTRFEIGDLPGTTGRVALALTGKGNPTAGVLAERAVDQFSPAAVLFSGIAGALWDTSPLGDVVMATHVYAFHGGMSEDDGFKARPRVWEVDHGIVQLAAHLGRTGGWHGETQPGSTVPEVHFGPIAAGEVVQNSRTSPEAVRLQNHYSDALAIEMEGAGVAQACHLSGSPVAIVRGISDRADGTKNTSNDETWQPRAAANAAAFAVGLAEELLHEQGDISMDEGNSQDCHIVTNYSAGPVGVQAGGNVSNNNVRITTPSHDSEPADLAAELSALCDQLVQECSTGNVDDATYAAARTELDSAHEALAEKTPEGNSRLVLALKRLRGLVANVGDLAVWIAALITVGEGLS